MKKALFILLLISSALTVAQEGVNIIIETNTPGALIYLDGKQAGVTGTKGNKMLRSVSTGNHTVKIEKDSYISFQTTIVVADLKNHFQFNLAKKKISVPRPDKQTIEDSFPQSAITPEIILVFFVFLILAVVMLILVKVMRSSRALGLMGKFELLGIIGKGGIATIYKAKDLSCNKTVALKVMDHSLVRDSELVQKFFIEGEVIEKINKEFPDAPVVKVFEHGRDREKSLGIPYIAMQMLKGTNLLGVIRSYSLNIPLNRKLYIIQQAAAALTAAHKLKIYHGDVTPDNIIVNGDTVTLIDFGVSFQEHDNYKNLDPSITGKPVYMSPEQCAGIPIDGKSDVYSLGIILFLMCNGTPPFINPNHAVTLEMHQKNPFPEITASIPDELKDFIKKMLAKEPEKRPDIFEVMHKMKVLMEQPTVKEITHRELQGTKNPKSRNTIENYLNHLKRWGCSIKKGCEKIIKSYYKKYNLRRNRT